MQFLVLAASALAASHIIQASDYKYEPAYLEIQAGDTVTWEGLEGHDVVQSKTANSCSRLASGFKFNPSTAVDVQFNTPGDFDYFCSVGFGTHCRMGMKATIKVLAPAKQVAAKTVHTIKVSNYKYDPQALTIKVGDTVNWEGLSGHDVVEAKEANSCSSKSGGLAIMPKSPSNTFKAAGVFNYYCSVGSHCSRGMKATITVVE